MDYKKLSEKNLDEIMAAIRRENGKNISCGVRDMSCFDSAEIQRDADLADVDYCIDMSVVGMQIGLRKAPMYNKKGLARKIARVIELIYLRIAELTNRDLRDFSSSIIKALRILRSRIERLFSNDQALEGRIESLRTETDGRLLAMDSCQQDQDTRINELASRLSDASSLLAVQAAAQKDLNERIAEQTAYQMALDERLATQAAYQAALDERLATQSAYQTALDERLSSHAAHQAALDERLATQAAYQTAFGEKIYEISDSLSRNARSSADTADKLCFISKRMSDLEGQVHSREGMLQDESVLSADSAGMTADMSMFYHDFEERFRGSQDDILSRLQVYKDTLLEFLGSFEGKTFVDLGCGRGEMLDFLRANGALDCTGVDINPMQLSICEEKGHKTAQMDCIGYLRSLESGSIDMVSAVQLVEHLPFESLAELLEECARVVHKGGVILLETPNCNNLITASVWFYVDPTHHRPVHPELLRFMAERSGFRSVRIIGANSNVYAKKLEKLPEENDSAATINKNYDMLNELLYGDQDYALIGVKK